MEEEAAYIFYREEKAAKEPGIKIFRIATDGSYNVTYPEYTGIETIAPSSEVHSQYYTLDGKQLSKPQKGMNIIRMSDGSVEKRLIP